MALLPGCKNRNDTTTSKFYLLKEEFCKRVTLSAPSGALLYESCAENLSRRIVEKLKWKWCVELKGGRGGYRHDMT